MTGKQGKGCWLPWDHIPEAAQSTASHQPRTWRPGRLTCVGLTLQENPIEWSFTER